MARKESKLWCPKCLQSGGTLTRRRAGSGNKHKNEYFYIMHYDPTKKSKKRSCYLGYAARLATITLNDERFCKYKDVIRVMDTNIYKNLHKDVKEDTLCGILNLLVDMGWPKRFVLEKLFADIYNSTLSRLWRKKDEELQNSAFLEKRRSRVDFSRYADTLEEILFDVFRSDGFRNLKEGLKLN